MKKTHGISFLRIKQLVRLSLIGLVLCSCSHPNVDSITSTKYPGRTIISKASYDVFANTTYMIISKGGTVIVADPFKMLDGITPDIITVSHKHDDHYDREFVDGSPGCKSIAVVENFKYQDIRGRGIAASHYGNRIDERHPNNIIFLFNVDSMRVAHMGDLGQDVLTPQQLAELGSVDVLIMNCSGLPMTEEKCLGVIKKINPSMILTTHTSRKGMRLLREYVDETLAATNYFELNPAQMKDGKKRWVRLRQDNYVSLFIANVFSDFVINPRLSWIWISLILAASIIVIVRRCRWHY